MDWSEIRFDQESVLPFVLPFAVLFRFVIVFFCFYKLDGKRFDKSSGQNLCFGSSCQLEYAQVLRPSSQILPLSGLQQANAGSCNNVAVRTFILPYLRGFCCKLSEL